MSGHVARRAFTVAEFHRMAEAGIFSEDDRVELLDGEIVEMTPIGSRHAAAVKRLIDRFIPLQVAGRVILSVQDPLRLGEHSEPQPDVVLLKPRADFYAAAHPGPEDVVLLVEVAETSAAPDREVKVPLYARFGVPEVWLVDLAEARVEVYRQPSAGAYQQTQALARGDVVSPHAFSDLRMGVAEILG
jgi:Uma2 family endonuclease